MKDELAQIVAHPLTGGAVIGSAVLSTIGQLAPLWDFLGATSGTWFPLIAVSAGTILPEVGLQQLGSQVLLAAAIVYVAIYADRLYDRIKERYS